MLSNVTIKNIALIDQANLEFDAGLNVLTGETGTGKSILLDALGFVLGGRGRGDLVRAGADKGEVSAVFILEDSHPAHAVLREAGFDSDGDLILRRVVIRGGKKTSFINDNRCSNDTLHALAETLVEWQGQYDDRGLLNPKTHRLILDHFGGLDTKPILQSWQACKEIEKNIASETEAIKILQTDSEFLRHASDEIMELAPEMGEEARLDSSRRLMQNAQKIRDDIVKAQTALSPQMAEGAMHDALRWLDGVADKAENRLTSAIDALGRALNELGDAQTGVEACLRDLHFNTADLELAEERLFAIRALARKHRLANSDDLMDCAKAMQAKLAQLDIGQDGLKDLKARLIVEQTRFGELVADMTEQRLKVGARLMREISAELPPLKLERARFDVVIVPTDAGPSGADSVSFQIAPNPGAAAGALNKIASGGELSRFLLALKVCLQKKNANSIMVFDEIDRGVGGATADAIGRRLAQLAIGNQVLLVTHSPQVAARATHQWRVHKYIVKGETFSKVEPLIGDARIDEIARMLAGDVITEAAREAARALVAG